MKIVVLSDTHGRHKKVLLPEGDMYEAYGRVQTGATEFINASILDAHYQVKNISVIVTW